MPITEVFDELGNAVLRNFGDYKKELAASLFENLMETTPVDTGTLRANWKHAPGETGGNSQRIENTGEFHDRPAPLDMDKYKRNWSVYTVFNFSEYVEHVNNGLSGNSHNQGFIGSAIAMTEVDAARFVDK